MKGFKRALLTGMRGRLQTRTVYRPSRRGLDLYEARHPYEIPDRINIIVDNDIDKDKCARVYEEICNALQHDHDMIFNSSHYRLYLWKNDSFDRVDTGSYGCGVRRHLLDDLEFDEDSGGNVKSFQNLYDINFRRYGISILITTAEKIEELKDEIKLGIRNLIVVCPGGEDSVVTHNDWAIEYFTCPLDRRMDNEE